MKRLISLLILLSIAVATPISAEEIRLTTIVPDQTVMKAKRGAIGETYSAIADGSIPTSALLVEGNVGIGTKTPSSVTKLEVSGNMILAPTNKPASGTEKPGMIYYDGNTTPGIMYYWNGSGAWVPMGGGGGGAFGDWVNRNTGQDYQASTDGFVMATVVNTSPNVNILGTVNGAYIAQSRFYNDPPGSPAYAYIMFPVRKGETWRVSIGGSGSSGYVLWMPVGN